MPTIIFFTGASGAGKSTIVERLSKHFSNDDDVQSLHFDSIGVPNPEEMIKHFGSGKQWQKQKTYKWIDRLLNDYSSKKLILFEGQTEIKFIVEAFHKRNFSNYRIVLVHANNIDRHLRLRTFRNHPELVNPEMDNWADFLMMQAFEFNSCVIDTTLNNLETIIKSLYDWLQKPDFLIKKNASCFSNPKTYIKR